METGLIAKKFWEEFMKYEKIIYDNLLKRNETEYNQSINIVSQITKSLNIENNVGIYFGIDIRNGMNLSERKDCIELIISPLFQRSNQKLTIDLYNESFKHNLPNYWSVVKYKFHRQSYIHTIILNYSKPELIDEKTTDAIVEITKDHFHYHSITNDEKTKISVLLFVDDDMASYLVKKEKYNDRDILIPKDNGIHAILDSTIGEYNLLNVLDKMEIHLKSETNQEDFKNIEIYPIENLSKDIEMIHNHSLSKFHTCSRCEYSNKQIKLYVCKCHKVYYCDSICQKAHREMHLLGGCK